MPDKDNIFSDFRSYRKGNPVIVGGEVKLIKSVSMNNNEIQGYTVHENGNMILKDHILPLKIDGHFLHGIQNHRREADGSYVFKGNSNRIDFFPDNSVCTVQLTINLEINGIHELMNLVKDVCEIDLPYRRHSNLQSNLSEQ